MNILEVVWLLVLVVALILILIVISLSCHLIVIHRISKIVLLF